MPILVFFFLFGLLFGADFTVPPNVTTTQNLADSGDTGTIESGGSIAVTGDNTYAVRMNSTNDPAVVNQTVTNSGTLSTAGTSAFAIYNFSGTSATIINNGTITATGTNTDGIVNLSASSTTITNNGTITAAQSLLGGIYSFDSDNCALTNNGTIISAAEGIQSWGSNCTLINTGFMSGASGLFIGGGNNNSLQNSGTIEATGFGIGGRGDNHIVENSGKVFASGSGGSAVFFIDNNIQIINSGTLSNPDGFAIRLEGTNPTLTLNRGSNLQGAVRTSGGALNLNIEKGQNLRLTIDDSSQSFGTLNVSDPYITVGNTETIAVLDPTGIAIQPDALEDLSDSILDDIYRMEWPYLNCCFPSCDVWLEGFGTVRRRKEDIHTRNSQGGVLLGLDSSVCDASSLGFFVGGSWGQAQVENDTQSADIQSYFAGLSYSQMVCDTFVGAAMLGGYFGWDNKRIVLFNLAPNGQETAKADAHGGLFMVDLTAAKWLGCCCRFRPLLSATLRYSGLFLGDYDESGSSSDLFVENRHISLLKPKLELGVSCTPSFCGWQFDVLPYIGVAGRFQLAGNRVESTMLGQELNFETGSPRDLAELLAGIYGGLDRNCCRIFFQVQGLWDTSDSSRFLGEIGLVRWF